MLTFQPAEIRQAMFMMFRATDITMPGTAVRGMTLAVRSGSRLSPTRRSTRLWPPDGHKKNRLTVQAVYRTMWTGRSLTYEASQPHRESKKKPLCSRNLRGGFAYRLDLPAMYTVITNEATDSNRDSSSIFDTLSPPLVVRAEVTTS